MLFPLGNIRILVGIADFSMAKVDSLKLGLWSRHFLGLHFQVEFFGGQES